jgi:PAS domain S-box-containing protein
MNDAIRLLIVDLDHSVSQTAIAAVGIAVTQVAQPAAAIDLLEQQEFDSLLIHCAIVDERTLALVHQVRDRAFRVAILVVTEQSNEPLAVELMQTGVQDYIAAPMDNHLVGRIREVVRLHRAEMLVQEALQDLRTSEERYRLVIEGSNDGIWDWYICQNEVFCNDRMFEILGLSREQLGTAEQAFFGLIHPDDQKRVLEALRSHLMSDTLFDVEFRLRHSTGNYLYCTSRGKAQRDRRGQIFRMSGIVTDISQRKLIEDAQRFLANASVLLSASLDSATITDNLARLAVPELADWCWIHLWHNGRLERVAMHPEAAVEYPFSAEERAEVVKTRRSQIYPNLEPPFCAAMIVPLLARERVLGTLTFAHTATHYSNHEVELAEDLGRRAGLAIDNAKLYQATQQGGNNLRKAIVTLLRQNQALDSQRQQIEIQNLKLKAAAQVKSQFLATMSHELRTPMNAIMGFSQLLMRQKTLSALQMDMVTRIFDNSKNLLALINDILDLSKIEAGRLNLNIERFDVQTLLNATVAELRSLSQQKQLTLSVSTDLNDPWMMGDSTRLKQVLINLLSNAIKFTDAGAVTVRLSERGAAIVITVQDTGIGIAQQDLEHIFEEFRQIDQSIARLHPGTGLGLAITKSLVEMMQGKISVESQLGVGSTFRVELLRQLRSFTSLNKGCQSG